ncbi:MAG TPA: hypothetical protein VN155_01225, partial [Devosia sp.]|nr:hypothetical protein [Devosia sp.]
PPGPVERYDPMAARPERSDRKQRYGSSNLGATDFEAKPTEAPRPPRKDFDKPRAPKAPAKDKGKPKWAGKSDAAPRPKKEKAAGKDHKPKRKPQI